MTADYGQIIAARRAKRNVQKKLAAVPSKPKKHPSSVRLHLYPLDNYTAIEDRSYIKWQDKETVAHARHMYKQLKSETLQVLVAPTGVGKTAIAVLAIAMMQKDLGKQIPFIVTAKSKALEGGVWQDTIVSYNEKHPENTLRPYMIESNGRLAAICADYNAVRKIKRKLGSSGVIVLDEIHKYKDPSSKRALQLRKLRAIKKIGLTATPRGNKIVTEGASYLIMGGRYNSMRDFVARNNLAKRYDHRYDLAIYNDNGSVDRGAFPRYDNMLTDLSRCFYIPDINLDDLDMPTVKRKVRQLPYSEDLDSDLGSLASAYKNRMFDSKRDFRASVIERVYTDKQRLECLCEIVENQQTIQPLIFYQHTAVLQAIREQFEARGISYQVISGKTTMEMLDKAKDDPVLIQYIAGGESIEFLRSNTSIIYENQASFINYYQAKGRNVRRGMSHNVDLYEIVAFCEFDQRMHEIVMNREEVNSCELDEIALRSLGVS